MFSGCPIGSGLHVGVLHRIYDQSTERGHSPWFSPRTEGRPYPYANIPSQRNSPFFVSKLCSCLTNADRREQSLPVPLVFYFLSGFPCVFQ
jgi:hypothetical protein